jgi:hypothetical protein
MARRKKKPRKHPASRVRKRWTRNPVQKPHSTKKGRKGYDRDEADADTRDRIERDLEEDE